MLSSGERHRCDRLRNRVKSIRDNADDMYVGCCAVCVWVLNLLLLVHQYRMTTAHNRPYPLGRYILVFTLDHLKWWCHGLSSKPQKKRYVRVSSGCRTTTCTFGRRRSSHVHEHPRECCAYWLTRQCPKCLSSLCRTDVYLKYIYFGTSN